MNRIAEIAARLAEINTAIDTATGDALTALETEVNALTAERTAIEAEARSRQELRGRIAAGTQPGVHAQTPAAAPPAAAQETVAQAEERAFADYILGRVAEMRTSTPQNFTMSNNGAVIPATIANRIIEAVTDICPILRGADVYHIAGSLKIPVYGDKADADSNDHNITVAYGADFSELTADAGAFTSVDLGGYLMGALTLIGRSVQSNAKFDVVSFVVRKMAEKIAEFIEGELLAGTGSSNSHCTGALSTSNSMVSGSISAITADNLIDLQAKIKQAYQANAVWTLHPNTFAAIKKLKYADGKYIVTDDFTGEFPYRLLGKPVNISDNMPTIASAAKAVLYGDYNGLSVNIREDISVEVLREKYATQHAIGVVAWLEVDSKVTDANKLATLVMSVS